MDCYGIACWQSWKDMRAFNGKELVGLIGQPVEGFLQVYGTDKPHKCTIELMEDIQCEFFATITSCV